MAYVCEQLAQGCYLKAEWPEIKLPKLLLALTITPLSHTDKAGWKIDSTSNILPDSKLINYKDDVTAFTK